MEWCCAAFRGHHEAAGQKGLTVFAATNSQHRYYFVLQYRAIDNIRNEALDHIQTPVTVLAEIAVRYCPWCGRRLARAYRKHIPEILRNDLKTDYD
jgi:hypothetical protein